MTTSEPVPPDPRWAYFGRFDPVTGRPRPLIHADLIEMAEKWTTTSSTPPGVANLLNTARALFGLAWFHYESMVVAGMWSLLAVEASLRVRLESEQSLVKLIGRAQRDGLITEQWAARLHAARQMRNDLAHARQQDAWTPGMASPLLATAHEVVAVLYPD